MNEQNPSRRAFISTIRNYKQGIILGLKISLIVGVLLGFIFVMNNISSNEIYDFEFTDVYCYNDFNEQKNIINFPFRGQKYTRYDCVFEIKKNNHTFDGYCTMEFKYTQPNETEDTIKSIDTFNNSKLNVGDTIILNWKMPPQLETGENRGNFLIICNGQRKGKSTTVTFDLQDEIKRDYNPDYLAVQSLAAWLGFLSAIIIGVVSIGVLLYENKKDERKMNIIERQLKIINKQIKGNSKNR